jgi:hypothetical protein
MDLMKQEKPLQPPFPDVVNWSENFCLAGYDPTSNISIWLHLGRWRKELTLWREILTIVLPDGSVIGHRAFGNARAAEDGPGAADLAIRVIEDRRKLSYRFDGMVRRVAAETLLEGELRDGPRQRLRFDLTFESNSELWDLHKFGGSQQFLGTGHIEQIGRLNGTIEVDYRSHDFAGMSNRDHSMGARDTINMRQHQWLQGYFENGISFLIYDAIVRGSEEPVFSEAVVYDGDAIFAGKLRYPWRIMDVADATKPYAFSIDYQGGTLDIEVVRMPGTSYLSFSAPNDIYVGVQNAGSPSRAMLEQSAILRLNGSINGFGNLERTVPGEVALEP